MDNIVMSALENVNGNTIGAMVLMTSQSNNVSKIKAKQTGFDHTKLFRVSSVQVQFGSPYSVRVNNQLAREGKDTDFIPKEAWYQKVKGALAIHKKDVSDTVANKRYYGIAFPMPNSVGESFYVYDGHRIDRKVVESYFVDSYFTEYEGRQGTDKETRILVPAIGSILKLSLNGQVIFNTIEQYVKD